MPKLYTTVLLICLLLTSATAQSKPTTKPNERGIILDIRMVEINPTRPEILEKIAKEKGRLDYMIGEGKAMPVASLQLQARSGVQSRARAGQRVPVQTATFPAFVQRPDPHYGPPANDPYGQAPIRYSTPQIIYENIGMSVEAIPRLLDGDQIEIHLELEMSDIERSTGKLTPIIIQRTISDTIIVRPNEPALLLGLIQEYSPSLPSSRSLSEQQVSRASGNFVVLVNARFAE